MSEFEQWYADNKDKLYLTDRIAAQNVWQAAEQLMQDDIADLQAQVDALRKDAELGKLVRQKMTSGNDVPVSRCTITSAEIDATISKGGE